MLNGDDLNKAKSVPDVGDDLDEFKNVPMVGVDEAKSVPIVGDDLDEAKSIPDVDVRSPWTSTAGYQAGWTSSSSSP